MKTLGQAAYEARAGEALGASDMPPWENMTPGARETWERAARAVVHALGRVIRCGDCGEAPGYYPNCPKCGATNRERGAK